MLSVDICIFINIYMVKLIENWKILKYVDMLCNIKFLDIKLKYKYGFIDFFFFCFYCVLYFEIIVFSSNGVNGGFYCIGFW